MTTKRQPDLVHCVESCLAKLLRLDLASRPSAPCVHAALKLELLPLGAPPLSDRVRDAPQTWVQLLTVQPLSD